MAMNLSRITDKHRANLEKVVRGSVFRVGAQIESKSPVDTGLFRSNWMPNVGGIDKSTTTNSSRNSSLALKEEVAGFRMGNTFYFTNNLPYARMLEFGGSNQAPNGMVRLAVRNIQRYVNEEIRKL